MAAPLFFVHDLDGKRILLDEDTSKHIIQVLRMDVGDEIVLTDGKGKRAMAAITDNNRKRCEADVQTIQQQASPAPKVSIAISLIKNSARFEWFLEKATEIGVSEIIPLLCERTEKEKFRHDRLQSILVAAMLQSQQSWLPVLHQPIAFMSFIQQAATTEKYIAHCLPEEKRSLATIRGNKDAVILIGPEGDFTQKEIASAIAHHFLPVTLGHTRLRTETAGVVAATLLCIPS